MEIAIVWPSCSGFFFAVRVANPSIMSGFTCLIKLKQTSVTWIASQWKSHTKDIRLQSWLDGLHLSHEVNGLPIGSSVKSYCTFFCKPAWAIAKMLLCPRTGKACGTEGSDRAKVFHRCQSKPEWQIDPCWRCSSLWQVFWYCDGLDCRQRCQNFCLDENPAAHAC